MSPRRGRQAPGGAALPVFALVLVLSGHAVVHPDVSRPGAWERYVLRVPNERDLPTLRVELEFPPQVRVVSFADVPGWTLGVDREGGERIVRAAWEGELGVGRFVEFPFLAVNPTAETRLVWRAAQTYADGEVVSWSGPEDSATPASFTLVRAGGGGASPAAWLAGVALVVGLLGLGLAVRPGREE